MRLLRVLTAVDAAWIVAGSMVGSGIFITPGLVAGHLPGVVWPLVAWLLGGLVSVCGALVYGELGARLPEAGGDYRYITEAYGPLWGFINGWAAITLTFSAAAAAQCRAATEYGFAAVGVDPPDWVTGIVAALAVVLLTWANTIGARTAGKTTTIFTAIPLLALLVLFFWGASTGDASLRLPRPLLVAPEGGWWLALSLALIPVFFTYSGWNAAAYLAGEMRDPGRSLARGLVAGTASVTLLYVLVNLALLAILTPGEIAGATSPAALAARRLLGSTGEMLLAATIAIAILGSANVTLMAGARVYYAMALDGMAPRRFARISPAGVPVTALWIGGAWSTALAIFGKIGDLVGWATLAILLLSSLTVTSLFVLRRRGTAVALEPDAADRPDETKHSLAAATGPAFRCPGYPVVPALFLLVSLGAAVSSFLYDPAHAVVGLAIIAAGFPLYYLTRDRFAA